MERQGVWGSGSGVVLSMASSCSVSNGRAVNGKKTRLLSLGKGYVSGSFIMPHGLRIVSVSSGVSIDMASRKQVHQKSGGENLWGEGWLVDGTNVGSHIFGDNNYCFARTGA